MLSTFGFHWHCSVGKLYANHAVKLQTNFVKPTITSHLIIILISPHVSRFKTRMPSSKLLCNSHQDLRSSHGSILANLLRKVSQLLNAVLLNVFLSLYQETLQQFFKSWFTFVVSSSSQLTPLHMAAISGCKNVVVYLVGKGADINTKDYLHVRQSLEGHGWGAELM